MISEWVRSFSASYTSAIMYRDKTSIPYE